MSILHRNHSNVNISNFTCYERRKEGNEEKEHPKKWVIFTNFGKETKFFYEAIQEH
jgi:hypothetical protein